MLVPVIPLTDNCALKKETEGEKMSAPILRKAAQPFH